MTPYANLSGHSGVEAFESGPGFIRVRFTERGGTYTYTYASAGRAHVDAMQRLAGAGQGLSTYIAQENPAYASKMR